MSVVMLSHLSLARGIYDELPQHLRHIRTAIYSEFGLDLKFFREVPLTSNYESRDGRRLTRLDEDEAMHAKTSSLWVVESKPTGQAMTQVKYRTLLASSNSSSIVCAAAQALCQNQGYITLGGMGRAKVLDILTCAGM